MIHGSAPNKNKTTIFYELMTSLTSRLLQDVRKWMIIIVDLVLLD